MTARLALIAGVALGLTSCESYPCPSPVFPELGDYTTTLPTGEEALVTLESERVVISYENEDGQAVEVVYSLESWSQSTEDFPGP